jgi:hypothetical protein
MFKVIDNRPFDIFLIELFPFRKTKWFPFHARATDRIKNLIIIFLTFIGS